MQGEKHQLTYFYATFKLSSVYCRPINFDFYSIC